MLISMSLVLLFNYLYYFIYKVRPARSKQFTSNPHGPSCFRIHISALQTPKVQSFIVE